MTVWICDWTHWQGEPLNAQRVQAEGFGMVKLKAGGAQTGGRYFEDPTFFASARALMTSDMLPAAYWYLMPGRPYAQAALFYDMLQGAGGAPHWAAFLDLEQPGVTAYEVSAFAYAWNRLTGGRPLALYTSQRFYTQSFGSERLAPLFRFLEEARWVPTEVRENTARPYASQQAKAIDPGWWDISYGGFSEPTILQFTDTALVDGRKTTASIFRGTKNELHSLLTVMM